MKKIFYRLIILGVIVFIAALTFAYWPTTTRSLTASEETLTNPEIIEKGKYLAVLGDCAACHSKDGGETYSGGGALHTPIGKVYSPNISPDKHAGIGTYTLDEFDRALRYGIRKDGVSLYPAMPYPSYAKISDEDVIALYAYFKNGVEPSAEPTAKNEIPWPLSIRFPMAIWRKIYAPEVAPFDGTKYPNNEITRGAYLVQGLAHCGACHTPRAITLQEKGLDETSPDFLAGEALIDGWVAINLLDNHDGLKNWSEEDIIESMSYGKNKKGAVVGEPMNEFVHQSGNLISDEDLKSIAAYIKSLPGKEENTPKFIAENVDIEPENTDGFNLYSKNCASCHGKKGDGNRGMFPTLSGNPSVLASNPQSVVRVTLEGSRHKAVDKKVRRMPMPGFAKKLSDKEAADIVTFIRTNFGNNAGSVSESEVKRIREEFIPSK